MALNWRSKLIHPQVAAPEGFRSLVTPTYRGSTTLLGSAGGVTDDWDQNRVRYTYGLYGTRWLAQQPEIRLVLHPALPSCPGHEIWKRDFTGSTSVFSIVFSQAVSRAAILKFVDALRLFKLGYSWGGVTSLALPYSGVNRQHRSYGERLVRLNVGLEDPQDLLSDLENALRTLR